MGGYQEFRSERFKGQALGFYLHFSSAITPLFCTEGSCLSEIGVRKAAELFCAGRGEPAREHSPFPVPADGGRDVHARVGSKPEDILHGDNREVRRAGVNDAHAGGAEPLEQPGLYVPPRHRPGLRIGFAVPLHYRGVVVGAGVGAAVFWVVVREVVVIGVIRVEPELEHAHSGESGVTEQLLHAVEDIA